LEEVNEYNLFSHICKVTHCSMISFIAFCNRICLVIVKHECRIHSGCDELSKESTVRRDVNLAFFIHPTLSTDYMYKCILYRECVLLLFKPLDFYYSKGFDIIGTEWESHDMIWIFSIQFLRLFFSKRLSCSFLL